MTHEDEDPVCRHFLHAAELIGKRWNPQLVRALQAAPQRFSELRTAVSPISDALLSERLRELEGAGVITRTVIPDTPVRIAYALSERGQELADVMGHLGAWAERWADAPVG